jgi:DNA polymerase V
MLLCRSTQIPEDDMSYHSGLPQQPYGVKLFAEKIPAAHALRPSRTRDAVPAHAHTGGADGLHMLAGAVPQHEGAEKIRHAAADRPLMLSCVAAGFPSPADDYIDRRLDLNEYLVRNPESTFYVRVHGESMRDAGIWAGDILVVDRAVQPATGRVVIAVLDGELTVKRLKKEGDRLLLVPENPDYSPVDVSGREDFSVWGVVTCVLHRV